MKKIYFFIFLIIILNACQLKTNSDINNSQNFIRKKSKQKIEIKDTIYIDVKSIPTPDNYKRIKISDSSFGQYIRNLKLKTTDNLVYLYDGTLKANQSPQFAVLNIDVGKQDLQQCADAVMRLRAEYLFSRKQFQDIHFNFLSDGKPRYFLKYSKNDLSYKKFRKYMNYIFMYANTSSLKNEMYPVKNIYDIEIGNVFIQGYGHAVTVMDIAEHIETKKKIFLLSQSYMPAQEIHILKNPQNAQLSPWYELGKNDILDTPEYQFNWSDLRKF